MTAAIILAGLTTGCLGVLVFAVCSDRRLPAVALVIVYLVGVFAAYASGSIALYQLAAGGAS